MVKPAQRKQIAKDLVSKSRLSERKACGLIHMSRSGLRYQNQQIDKDCKLVQRMLELAKRYPSYGYLMLHGLLKNEGLVVNKKRTYRLYTQARLQLRTKKRKKLSRPCRVLTVPAATNERWSIDFIHDQLSGGRRFRILNIVDDYSRECIGQLVGTSISGERVAQYLSQLIQCRSKPSSIVCDNGTEFTSKAMFHWSRDQRVSLDFIQPGKPTQNAFVESFNGKFRDSCLNQYWFHSLNEASRVIENWRVDYNEVRPHSSLGYQPPSVFANKIA